MARQGHEIDLYFASYFAQNKPVTDKTLLVRITNGLIRSRIETMDALCAMSPEQICKLRNLGKKSIEVILQARDKYIAEQK